MRGGRDNETNRMSIVFCMTHGEEKSYKPYSESHLTSCQWVVLASTSNRHYTWMLTHISLTATKTNFHPPVHSWFALIPLDTPFLLLSTRFFAAFIYPDTTQATNRPLTVLTVNCSCFHWITTLFKRSIFVPLFNLTSRAQPPIQ